MSFHVWMEKTIFQYSKYLGGKLNKIQKYRILPSNFFLKVCEFWVDKHVILQLGRSNITNNFSSNKIGRCIVWRVEMFKIEVWKVLNDRIIYEIASQVLWWSASYTVTNQWSVFYQSY